MRVQAGSSNGQKIPLPGIYWGTTDLDLIELQILDTQDVVTMGDLDPKGFLTEAPSNVWPFVTNAWLTDADGNITDIVGNEKVNFHVTFNRDMDTSIPLDVRFGSAYPYADYQVKGSYTDARTWTGTITLNTLIEGGYHCWSITNGRAADAHHKTLYKDCGRFPFQINTVEANAMLLRGSAVKNGILLEWEQDDFAPETIAGYNVYRSDSLDGQYTRLNATVIPFGQEEFLDNNVESSKVYFYNFTVVLTGGTTSEAESAPSGKIQVLSPDTIPPTLLHTPVNTGISGLNLTISAMATDDLNLSAVTLFYRLTGESQWTKLPMTNLNDKYSAIIPGSAITTAGLEYYISASDGVSTITKGSSLNPFPIQISETTVSDRKGDVNGDGTITVLDAYMVLQAINDRINLTTEEFNRADLNDDGSLSSAEALAILNYANGKTDTLG